VGLSYCRMAPEVIACETLKDTPYDTKADIWSLGMWQYTSLFLSSFCLVPCGTLNQLSVSFGLYVKCMFQGDQLSGNLEISGNLTVVREMSGKKILSEKSCLKLFIVSCIFASIQVFSRSLFCVKY